ncbi:hypothetical protein AWENTII_011853 [Aspergillus wentii]
MQFTTLFFTLMASTMVMALPTEEVGTGTASAQVECPSGWVQCGECNGTSCKVAGTDR